MEKDLMMEYLHLIEDFKVSDPKMIEYKKRDGYFVPTNFNTVQHHAKQKCR